MRRMMRLARTRCAGSARAIPALVAALVLGVSVPAFAQTTPSGGTPSSPSGQKPGKGAKDKRQAEKQTQQNETEAAANAAKTNQPVETPPEKPKEEKEVDRAIYISADVGFTRMDLGGLSNNLAFDKTAANGVTWSVGAGLRLKDLKLGVRWRVNDTTEFDFWTFMLEAGYSLPLRPVSPGFTAHLGYIYDQSLQRALFRSSVPGERLTVLDPNVDVHGVNVGVEAQAMYWVSRYVRAGAFLGFDLNFLSRPEAGLPGSTFPIPDEIRNKPLYTESGSSVGYTFNVGLRGAFDVGF